MFVGYAQDGCNFFRRGGENGYNWRHSENLKPFQLYRVFDNMLGPT
jgi:hypothetical protein